MNKILLTSAILFVIHFVPIFIVTSSSYRALGICQAQTYCGSARYDSEVFPNVTVTSDVVYGSNADVNNSTVILKMDIYEPTGDTAAKRPVVIMAHGGSFVSGSKTDSALIMLCTRFAKRGYVTASIDYRLGLGFPIDSIRAMRAVWRAVQDMKASIRYFRKDAYTVNTYRVDPNMIFAGGASAGAIMAVHLAYLDQPSEVPSTIDTVLLGGLEGNSGNQGYASCVKAIVNIAGAVADTCWMQSGDEPMLSVQGNADNTVPYCTDVVYLSIFPIMIIHGSGTMNIRANNTGIPNPIHTFYGQGHSSPGSPGNFDTTVVLMNDFLYTQMGCTPSNTITYTNIPVCITNLPNSPSCITGTAISSPCITSAGVSEIVLNNANVSLYPNPASENLILTLKNVKGTKFSCTIHDITGRKVIQFNFSGKEYFIRRNKIKPGIYFLKIVSDADELPVTKIVFAD